MNDPKRRHYHHLHHRFPPPAFSPPSSSSSSSSSSSTSNPPPLLPLASPSPPLPHPSPLFSPATPSSSSSTSNSSLRFPPSSSSYPPHASHPPSSLLLPSRPSNHLLPLSPHDINSPLTLSDSASSTSSASGDLHRLFPSPDSCAQSRGFHGPPAASLFSPPNGYHHPAAAPSPRISHIHGVFSSSGRTGNGVPNGVSLSDLPIVRGPVSSQPPAQMQIMGDARPTAADQESKRLKLVLEDLERELLGDDDDPAVATTGAPAPIAAPDACSHHFTVGQQNTSSAQAAREPRDWTDVIEDLLQASDAATALDQTSNVTSMCSNPNSSGEDGFVSAAESSSPTTTLDHSTVTTVCSGKLPLSPATGVHPRDLLLACANAINKEDYTCAEGFLSSLQQSSSIYGDPCQRLAVYMAAALEARIEKMTGRRQAKLLATPPSPSPETIFRGKQLLYRWCPYMKFGFLAANQAIVEALEGERSLHIVDFSICSYGADQWLLLLDFLSRRGGALPRVRITGVVGAAAADGRQAEAVGRAVCEHGRRVGVGVEFGWVIAAAAAEDGGEEAMEAVQRRAGEALAVNWLFYLHGVADESVSERNPRDALLRGVVRRMRPRVVALVEHDANTNTPPFYQRFLHALTYFTALFESLDGKSMRDNKERVNAEQQCLGRDMIDIVACEGAERRRRYDVAGKWRARMAMAGMGIVRLRAGEEVRALLSAYSPKYTLREEEGMLRLGWGGTPLVAASAWRPLN